MKDSTPYFTLSTLTLSVPFTATGLSVHVDVILVFTFTRDPHLTHTITNMHVGTTSRNAVNCITLVTTSTVDNTIARYMMQKTRDDTLPLALAVACNCCVKVR